MEVKIRHEHRSSLLAGAVAGFCVDSVLFPLDTIKTRLQSQNGFKASGGFSHIYKGITPVLLTSAPGAALFFITYSGIKNECEKEKLATPLCHMLAACAGETVACLIRVPTEVIKQRRMVSNDLRPIQLCLQTFSQEGVRGFYRGFFTTLIREIPFSIIQFPLWEFFKRKWASKSSSSLQAWQSALCGSIAGGLAALITTPMDVAKTRIILADKSSCLSRGQILFTLQHVYMERGLKGLFQGAVPRVLWISLGGAIFLGAYDFSRQYL